MSSEVVVPLYLWNAMPHHLEALKAVKATLKTDKLVKPVTATPEAHGRVLCFRERPPFACENFLVSKPEMLPDALKWAMHLTDEGDQDYAGWLRETLGVIGVKEVQDGSAEA